MCGIVTVPIALLVFTIAYSYAGCLGNVYTSVYTVLLCIPTKPYISLSSLYPHFINCFLPFVLKVMSKLNTVAACYYL